MLKAKKLNKGDTIGLICPSSGFWERSRLWSAIEQIENWGYKVKTGKYVESRNTYFAGTDEQRAEDLMNMFCDDSVDAIMCCHGGYGAARLWRHMDFDAIKSNPKIFVGYSDVTALHLAIHKKTNLVTFHGPGSSRFSVGHHSDYNLDYLMRAIASNQPIGKIEMANKDSYLLKIAPGEATGEIIGGNLSLICSTIGTPYEIDTKGKILVLEDLDIEPWVMDHLITHLYNCNKLQEAAGIVIGECVDCEPRGINPGFVDGRSLEEVLLDILSPLGIPVISGLPLGHTRDLATLPMGIRAYLNGNTGEFRVDEVATL